MKLGRKGLGIGDLSGVGTILVTTGLVLAIGAYILSSINVQVGYTATMNNTFQNATAAVAQLSQWLPIIAIVVAAGIILGVLAMAFMPRQGAGV